MTHGKVEFHETEAFGRTWLISTTPDVMVRLKRIFPRVHRDRTRGLVIHHTREVARDLRWVLERWPMEISAGDRRRLEADADSHVAAEEACERILAGGQVQLAGALEPARKPRDYQRIAADLCATTGQLLCADDLGLGKTFTGLLLLRDPAARPALVVCPTHLALQWLDELHKSFPMLSGHIVRTRAVYNPAEHRSMKGHDPDVLIITYAKLSAWAEHLAGQVRTVIFDECQELRRAESQKYVAAGVVADQADLRMGLTATPVYNYGGEIHSVMSVLAPDALGSRDEFIREWGAQYGNNVGVSDPAALGHHLRNERLLLRRTRREVGRELPDVVRIPHTVESNEETVDRLSGDAAGLAALILDKAADRKERFTAGGQLDAKMRHATGVGKAPYVAEFVRMLLESDEKVVLFGWHRDVYDTWLGKLADHDPLLYTGSESPAAKARNRDAFIEGDHQLFVMSLRAGAGLDGLQDVSHVCVFGELDWSPGMHDQCIGRLHRDGQGESIAAYFLISDHGADPLMAQVLNLKRMQAEPLRDPDAPLLEQAEGTEDRIRKLAEQVLERDRRAGRLAAEAA